MSNELVCPFCQQELEIWHTNNRVRMYACPDLTCKGYYMSSTKDMWQELIRTRKALETLQEFITKLYLSGKITDEQLERYKKMLITALEQKEIK